MAFLPPIELPDLSDLCPAWLESIFRRYENNVEEEAALAAAEAELAVRSKRIAHQYSDVVAPGRLNDGTDNMEEQEEEDEEGDPGDEEYESGEGEMDDMDADDYYMDEGNIGINTADNSVTTTITLPMPSTSTSSTIGAGTQQSAATEVAETGDRTEQASTSNQE